MNKIYSKNNFKNNWNKKSFGMFFVFSFFTLIFTFISIFPNLVLGAAGVPALINFQGRLLDSSGNLLGGTSGTEYCYKFSIYDAVSAGSKIWPAGSPSTMTITTREGVFNANVGDTGAGGDTLDLAFTDDQAFMNVEVATKVGATCAPGDGAESFETLSPRQRIVSSAFAINSKTVGGFTPAQSATGSQIPALTSGSLVLGDTNPGLRVTGSNTLTFQNGVTGDIQFYSSSNKITSAGALTIAGGFTSSAGTITLGGLGGGGTQCLQVDNSGVVTGTGGVCGAGSVTWNSLTNPTGTQSLTFDDGELNAWTVSSDTETFQTITANSLTTGKVLAISSSSLSSGSLVDLTVTGTAGLTGQKGLNISLSGANGTGAQTTYGAYLSNTHTGTSTNVGLYATATGGSNNYAAIFENGYVGIGTTTPATLLETKGTSANNTLTITTSGGSSYIPKLALNRVGDTSWNLSQPSGAFDFTIDQDGNRKLTIQNTTGNVGIGDTTPDGLLDIEGTGAVTTANYGINLSNLTTNATTDAINKYGAYITSTGTWTGSGGTATNNYGLYVDTVSGADNNYGAYFAGYVGIGNTTPTHALDVTGYIRATQNIRLENGKFLSFGSSSGDEGITGSQSTNSLTMRTNGADRLFIDSSGNVGIGSNTTLNDKLQVSGNIRLYASATDNEITFQDDNVAHGLTDLITNTSGTSIHTRIKNAHAANGGTEILGVTDADGSTGINLYGVLGVTDPTDTIPAVTINTAKKNTTNVQSLGSLETVLQVQNNTSALLSVLGSGNVGIGVLSPSYSLDVVGSYTTARFGKLILSDDAPFVTGANINSGASGLALGSTGATPVYFFTNNTEKARITSGGNFGIGTTGPGQALSVSRGNGIQSAIELIQTGANQTLIGSKASDANTYISNTTSSGSLGTAGVSITLNSSGNVGIGTTSPSQKLSVLLSSDQIIAGFGANSVQDLFTIGYNRTGYISSETTIEGSTYGAFGIRSQNNNHIIIYPHGTGNVGIGVNSPTEKLHISGNIKANNLNQTNYSVTIPTTVADAIDIATVTNTNFSSNVELWFTVHDASYAQSKRYIVPVSYDGTGGAWQKLLPVSTTGAYSGNDAEIDVSITNAIATFRVRRTAGSTAGTAKVTIAIGGDMTGTTVASSSNTYTGASSSANYAPTSLTMKNGKTGINNDSPTAFLDIIGTTEQFRVGYDNSNYLSTTISSTGGVTLAPTGSTKTVHLSGVTGFGINVAPSTPLQAQGALSLTDTTNFDFTRPTGLIVGKTVASVSGTPNAPESVLTLARTGESGVIYPNFAEFRMSRWENVSSNARTQLDLVLNNTTSDQSTFTNVMSLRSNGNVGIGDTSPASLFTVGSGDLFQVNSSGAIAAATGITSSGTITFSGLGGGGTQCVKTDNSGVLSAGSCGGGGGAWSDLTAPTGNLSLAHGSYTTGFTYNSVTTSNAFSLSSSSLSSGTLLDLAVTGTAAASNTQKVLNISNSGANATSTQTTYGGYFSNTRTGTSSTNVGLYTTASGGTTNLGLNVDGGQTLLGGTTLTSGTLAKLNIVSTNSSNGSTTAIAGIHGEYTFNNGGASSYVQVGNRFVFNNAPTTNANTMAGEIIRTVDNTTLANLVRGIEVTSNAGSNTAGTNTGIRTTGGTFGIQAITNGSAGSQSLPAAIYGENTGTTQGDILRLYSNSMTSASQMAQFYHNSSTFTGNGLLMDFAEGSGTFSGNFVDFQKNNTTLFRVTNGGVTSLGFSTNQTATSAVCSTLANATAPTADTLYELRDCGGTPVADYAEMYPVESGVEFGDIVVTGSELVETYDLTDGIIDWTKVKGTITKLVKSDRAYQGNVIGIVSDNFGDFSSTGYNIKEGDNPMPVALVGRLPVKIAATSNDIKAGDYITTSSEQGRGMKAIKAGVVIGKALEDWTATSGKNTVMVFVEQGYYNGISATSFAGIDMNTTAGDEVSKQILAKLILEENNIDPLNISELLTDRVVAGLEIITPDLVAENVNTDNLIVEENAKFAGLSNFTGEASFMNKVSFDDVVEFKAPPMWNSDTAGFATVLAGAKKVEVVFDNPYMVQPVVNASISLEDNLENENENMTEEEINNFFNQDIKYVITNKTQNGFTININKESDKDIKFSWVALAVKDAKNFESLIEGLVIENNSNVNPPTINPEIENNPTSENPEENNSSTESVLGDTTTNIEENTNTESTNDTNSQSAQTIVTETIDESASSNTSIIEPPSESNPVIE